MAAKQITNGIIWFPFESILYLEKLPSIEDRCHIGRVTTMAANLYLIKLEFLTAGGLQINNVRHRAKFCRNR